MYTENEYNNSNNLESGFLIMISRDYDEFESNQNKMKGKRKYREVMSDYDEVEELVDEYKTANKKKKNHREQRDKYYQG